MARKLLNQVRVAAPCHVAWSEMEGDDRMRYCGSCKLNVFNLSDMGEQEAEEFVRCATGRTCVRYFKRADGTILTRDCPVGRRPLRRRLAFGLLAVATLFVSAFGLAVRPQQQAPTEDVVADGEESAPSLFDQAFRWLLVEESEQAYEFAGAMITLPPPSHNLFATPAQPKP